MRHHPASRNYIGRGLTPWNSVNFEPVTLTMAMAAMSAAGAVVSAVGQMRAGNQANEDAKFQSNQLDQQAGQERAASQRSAIEDRRRSTISISNAQAAAASSGGSAVDPTVLNITGGLAAQGEYNALSSMYEGEERAHSLELQATSERMRGKAAKKAGKTAAIGTILSEFGKIGSGLASKYSPGVDVPVTTKGPLPWQAAGNINPEGGFY